MILRFIVKLFIYIDDFFKLTIFSDNESSSNVYCHTSYDFHEFIIHTVRSIIEFTSNTNKYLCISALYVSLQDNNDKNKSLLVSVE